MVKALKAGDKVIVNPGIFGTIVGVEDDAFQVRIDDKTKIKVLKSAVAAFRARPTNGEVANAPALAEPLRCSGSCSPRPWPCCPTSAMRKELRVRAALYGAFLIACVACRLAALRAGRPAGQDPARPRPRAAGSISSCRS